MYPCQRALLESEKTEINSEGNTQVRESCYYCPVIEKPMGLIVYSYPKEVDVYLYPNDIIKEKIEKDYTNRKQDSILAFCETECKYNEEI